MHFSIYPNVFIVLRVTFVTWLFHANAATVPPEGLPMSFCFLYNADGFRKSQCTNSPWGSIAAKCLMIYPTGLFYCVFYLFVLAMLDGQTNA